MATNNGKSRNARINKATKTAYLLYKSLEELQGYQSKEVIDEKEVWAKSRIFVNDLCQCFHEANAYNNAMKE